MKKRYLFYLIICLLIPTIVFAKSNSNDLDEIPAFGYALFISIFHLVFILMPIMSSRNSEFKFAAKDTIKYYAILVGINAIICDVFGVVGMAIGFFSVFVIGFPAMFFTSSGGFRGKVNDPINVDPSKVIEGCDTDKGLIIKCLKCGNRITVNNKYCEACGADVQGNNVKVEKKDSSELALQLKSFDNMYAKSEEELIKLIITNECKSLGLDPKSKLIPRSEKVRYIILDIIFCILLFLFIGLIFYHVSIRIYAIGILILILFFIKKNKFDLYNYLYKEVKARPNENIDNIIGALKENLVPKEEIVTRILLPILVVLISLIIFKDPIILYEPLEDGYAVRFYFTGWSSLTHATIPEEHNGKKVISLRGNAFSNMPLLNEVYLPDSIYEIRGEAFKNDFLLKKVHLPANLKYLGGESFYHCIKLEEVNFTYEMPLEEIKGNTFEECTSLKKIVIPDSVTRIGGHAFHGDDSLSEVSISENSSLTQIGSSAFRECTSLKEIILPIYATYESNSFKGSYTKISKYGSDKDYLIGTINLELDDVKSYTLPEYGTIKLNYYSYNATKGLHKVDIYGTFNKNISFVENYKYSINDTNYIEFESTDTSEIVVYFYKVWR